MEYLIGLLPAIVVVGFSAFVVFGGWPAVRLLQKLNFSNGPKPS